jgi:hypothetical protein
VDEKEQPWLPGPANLPFTLTLLNPMGDRHLAFDDDCGQFYRLWQHRSPEPLTTQDAIRLRPSDIDMIIKTAGAWILSHTAHPRAGELIDEIAAGAKGIVLYFASADHVTVHVAREDRAPAAPSSTGAAFARYLDRTRPGPGSDPR